MTHAGSLTELVSNSPQETFDLGRKTAARLVPGSVVAMRGTLGSGKTQFAKGIARALGITENLTSPTYTIINEYQITENSDFVLYHIDAYRLDSDRDFEDIGGLDIVNSKGICLIEWSERILKSIPLSAVTVSLEITGATSRLIRIKGLDNL